MVVGAGVGVVDAGGIGCTTKKSKNSSWSVASSLDIPLDLNRLRTRSKRLKWGKGTSVSSKTPVLFWEEENDERVLRETGAMPSRDVGETMAQGGRLGVARRVAFLTPFFVGL